MLNKKKISKWWWQYIVIDFQIYVIHFTFQPKFLILY